MKIAAVTFGCALALGLTLTLPVSADPINLPPPGGAFLDLNGLALPNGGNGVPGGGPGVDGLYTGMFTATSTSTTLTLAFRDDGAFVDLYAAGVADITSPHGELITNPNFNLGVQTQNGNAAVPTSWNYDNIYGASFGGADITGGCSATNGGATIGTCWHDGATQAYDALSQGFSTTSGDQYELFLLLAEDNNTNFAFNGTGNGYTAFSQLSTNGNNTANGGHDGNAIDLLAYALPGENNIPAPVPEPATWALLATGLIGLGLAARRSLS